jgi:hypothetical protein
VRLPEKNRKSVVIIMRFSKPESVMRKPYRIGEVQIPAFKEKSKHLGTCQQSPEDADCTRRQQPHWSQLQKGLRCVARCRLKSCSAKRKQKPQAADNRGYQGNANSKDDERNCLSKQDGKRTKSDG